MSLDTSPGADVKQLARKVESHDVVERFAKAGLGSRALVWLLIGALAASVGLGIDSGADTDQSGALRTLADTPGGLGLLLLVAAGFLAYSAYRVLTAAVGYRQETGRKRLGLRLKSGVEALLFGTLAVTTLRTAFGTSASSEEETRSAAGTVMDLPGGRTAVGLVGAGLVVLAVVLFVRALKQHHAEHLDTAPVRARTALLRLGVAGLGGRSLALALVGGFLVLAALRFDPDEAKGLDAALETLAQQPFGSGLLLVAAASFLCYGLWSLAEMLWRDV